MAPKRAKMFSYGNDDRCEEVRKFIEDAGILLDVRDISKKPLTVRELKQLVGHLNIDHFINKLSEAYSKHKLDEGALDRNAVLQLMTEEPTLLRRPIIQGSRLVVVGCDKKKIAEMLQIGGNNNSGDHGHDNRGNRRMAHAHGASSSR